MGKMIRSFRVGIGVLLCCSISFADGLGDPSQFYDPYVYPRGEHLFDINWESTDETLQALKSGRIGRRPASIEDLQNLSRPYEGGRDEQPISVQEDLPRPTVYWTHKMVYKQVVRELEDEVSLGEDAEQKSE